MKVQLLTSTETITEMERNAALATLTCHANTDRDYVPSEVLERIIKAGHESILEHITLTYSVKGLSRACLQELARHRHISLSVESTRHTLRKQLNEDYCVEKLGVEPISRMWEMAQELAGWANEHPDLTNDELKYYLPEFWPTNLVLTLNIRELRHILQLRTAPAALKEFQDLARALFEAVPEQFRYLLADCVYVEAENG